jgi:hypothetical protein
MASLNWPRKCSSGKCEWLFSYPRNLHMNHIANDSWESLEEKPEPGQWQSIS